ncbi:MAG: peptidylprolyl isomerase [Bacilli bacterium]|nr:peptidylprolyl isomerase [Bacilli bacterium]
MKKKLILMIITIGLLTGCGKIPKLSNGEEAIVKFDDGTMYSVDEIWNEVKDNYALSVLLTKIDEKILLEEYKDKKEDLDKYLSNYETYLKSNYVDDNGKFDEQAMNEALASRGYSSIDILLDQQKVTYLTDLAVKDYAKSKITDKQVSDYYKNEATGDIHCKHILVKPNGTDNASNTEAKEKAEKILNDIKEDIKKGTSATEAFEKYKDNSEVTFQDLDYFNKGDMVEEFEKAAFALKKGGYTDSPVKTTYGYHLIVKLDEKEKDSLENLSDSIKETLAEKLIEDDVTTEVNAMVELRKKHGANFQDSKLEEQYNRYINSLLNQKKATN